MLHASGVWPTKTTRKMVTATFVMRIVVIVCTIRQGKLAVGACARWSIASQTLDLLITGTHHSLAGHGAATFINLPTGNVVANFEGAVNDPTLTCNVTNEGIQIDTFWSIENFEGVPTRPLSLADPNSDFFLVSGDQRPNSDFTYFNHLTILNWTVSLDKVILHCGSGREPEQASVMLRIYSEYTKLIESTCLVKYT